MSEAIPKRGEVWWVDFEPARGSEASKVRPAVVISSLRFEHLPVRIVVPLTTWQPRFQRQLNKVFLRHSTGNGLALDSGADVMLLRGVAVERFQERVGVLDPSQLDDMLGGLLVAIDFDQ